MPDFKAELSIAGETVGPSIREESGVRVTCGKSDGASRVDPGRMTLKINNRDGVFSESNPLSPYYGKLGRNTPINYAVRGPLPYLRLDGGYTYIPAAEAPVITGDLDVRAEIAWDSLGPIYPDGSLSIAEIAGRYDATTLNRGWRFFLTEHTRLALGFSPDGVDFWTYNSEEAIPYFAGQRFAVRATLDVDNGSGGHTVRYYTAPTMDGPWSLLGAPDVNTDTTLTLYGAEGADLELGDLTYSPFPQQPCRLYKFQLRDGIVGTVVADIDFTQQTVGDAGPIVDAAGNEWTLTDGAEVTDWYNRFAGEVSAWPQGWDQSGQDSWVTLDAAGPLRRLSSGNRPLFSTLRQRVPAGEGLLAYWPLEDGPRTTRAASPLEGVEPLTLVGASFASESSMPGSAPLPVVGTDAYMRGRVPLADSDGWHFEMTYKLGQLPATERVVQAVWLTGSPIHEVRVSAGAGVVRLRGFDHEGAVVINNAVSVTAALTAFTAGWNRLQIFSHQDGSTGWVTAMWNDVLLNTRHGAWSSFTGSVGRVTSVSTNWHDDLQGLALGHIGVFAVPGADETTPGVTIYQLADDGFNGEYSEDRVRRIAWEQGLPVAAHGIFTAGERMGPQPIATAMDILRDCESAEGALLGEARNALTLNYLTRSVLINRPVSLVLDAGAGELGAPLNPVRDDKGVRNEITVTREGGGSSMAARQEEGPLSVDAIGAYPEDVTLNLYTDEQTDGAAGWLLRLRTVDEARVPTVELNLRNPAMAQRTQEVLDMLVCQSVITLRNTLYTPDDVRLVVEGYTEIRSSEQWRITLNCAPASPWDAWQLDGFAAAEARLDTDGSSLAEPVSDSATQLTVISDDVTWVTADEPLNANPYFDTDISGWVPMAGAVIAWDSGYLKMVTGGAADNRFQPADYSPVTSGSAYSACAWVHVDRPVPSQISVSVNWYDASNIYMATTTNGVTVGPDEWTFIEGTHTAPVGAAGAKIQVVIWGTPGAGTVLRATNVAFRPHSSMAGDFPFEISVGGEICRVTSIADVSSDTQTFTVERSLNGIEMEHPAGTPVALAAPTYLAPGE